MKVTEFTVVVGEQTFHSIEEGLLSVEKHLEDGLKKSSVRVSYQLLQSLKRVAREMERNHGLRWPGATGSDFLNKRSGGGLKDIRDSIHVAANVSDIDQVEGSIGAAFPMSVHEEGAEISARRSRYLTIPLPAALDNRGIPLRASARDWEDTFVARSRRGNLLIFQRRGKEIVPLYILKERVRIPARLGLGATVEKELPYFEAKALGEIERALAI